MNNKTNIVQSGLAKSGNYWLYNIIREIISSKEDFKPYIHSLPIYPFLENLDLSTNDQADVDVLDFNSKSVSHRVSSFYNMPLVPDEASSFISSSPLIWTHSKLNLTNLHYKEFDKVVYIVRDPRSVAISLAHFLMTPYMKKYYYRGYESYEEALEGIFIQQMEAWYRHIYSASQFNIQRSVYVVFYENLLLDPKSGVRELAQYLEYDLPERTVREIVNKTSLQTMSKRNPSHVRSFKKKKGWEELLSANQKKYCKNRLGCILETLGYKMDCNTQEMLVWDAAKTLHACKKFNMQRYHQAIKRRLIKF